MRLVACLLFVGAAAFALNAARAYPDGSPWGAANPSAEQNCATCHFDYDPVHDSNAILLEGLPEQLLGNQSYDLTIRFDEKDAVISGFQMIAQATTEEAGTFSSAAPDVEFIGAAIRSTAWREYNDGVAWTVRWQTPSEITAPIVFFVAASSSNYDGSPFGDTIHFRSFTIPEGQ